LPDGSGLADLRLHLLHRDAERRALGTGARAGIGKGGPGIFAEGLLQSARWRRPYAGGTGKRTGGNEHGAAGGRGPVCQVRGAHRARRSRLSSTEGGGEPVAIPGEHLGGGGQGAAGSNRAADESAARSAFGGILQ